MLPPQKTAALELDLLEQKWSGKYPYAIRSRRTNWDKQTSFFDFPVEIVLVPEWRYSQKVCISDYYGNWKEIVLTYLELGHLNRSINPCNFYHSENPIGDSLNSLLSCDYRL